MADARTVEEDMETSTNMTWLNKRVVELETEVKRLREQYTELKEALVGDSPNWTHEELIERALELIDNAFLYHHRESVELLEWAEKTHPAYLNNLKKGFKGYQNE